MSREDRDYVEPPVKVDLDKDGDPDAIQADAIQAEGQAAEGEQVIDEDAEGVSVDDEGDSPEDERTRIAREYDERMGNVTAEAEGEGQDDPGTEAESPEQVEVTINGQTRLVDADKVEEAGGVVAYQKSLAADQGLRELAEQRRAFNEQVQRFNAAQAETQDARQRAPATPEDNNPAPSEDGLDKGTIAKKALEALYDGEDETAAQYLVQLTEAGRGEAPIDLEAVKREAAQAGAALQYQRDLEEGKEDFAIDYPDIAKSQQLFHAADQLTKQVAQEHPHWRPQRVLKETGKRIMAEVEARNKAAGGTAADKLAAKRASTNVGANSVRGKPRPAPKPQTDSDYVASLVKRRGLSGG